MNKEEYQEIINNAIQLEIDAANFYRGLQEQVKNDSSKVLLKELENMEWGHKHILEHLDVEGIENYQTLNIPDLKISESLLDPADNSYMSIQDVLATAIKREEEAMKLYTRLADETEENRIKNLFVRLADEEAKHKLQLETIYDTEILYEN